jgi:hypothetical protein
VTDPEIVVPSVYFVTGDQVMVLLPETSGGGTTFAAGTDQDLAEEQPDSAPFTVVFIAK